MIAVVTTISNPTRCIIKLAEKLKQNNASLIVAGDNKSPDIFELDNAKFLSLDDQNRMQFRLSKILPVNHYCRKNLGYLDAIHSGAKCLYETDDDNAPLEQWFLREEEVRCADSVSAEGMGGEWVNVYRYFTKENIWPRGLPLDKISHFLPELRATEKSFKAPIQQGLVNNCPDVDAIWRLTMDRPFEFNDRASVYIEPGLWCPFNTQSTWWWPKAYPLLYIPSYCSFRMCDIWKSFVAQRCLWELGYGIVFHAPEVYQDRNEHNLMKDFEDEIPGYLGNHRFATVLDALSLKSGVGNVVDNLILCYESLIKENFFPANELTLVKAWAEDVEQIM